MMDENKTNLVAKWRQLSTGKKIGLVIFVAYLLIVITHQKEDPKNTSGSHSSTSKALNQDSRNVYLYCLSSTYSCFLTPAECENEARFHVGKSCQPIPCGTGATHANTALCDRQFLR